jgi:hypothetical protein
MDSGTGVVNLENGEVGFYGSERNGDDLQR